MDDRAEGDLRAQVQALEPWFHNLHLPGGIQSAPDHFLGDFPSYKWQELSPWLPADLTGWRVLDIGCNAGFYSFELARRGARVTAVDMNDHYLAQARWAAGVYGLADSIDFLKLQVYDLVDHEQTYDLVLFMGVFYHLRYPLLGLDIVARRVGRLLCFQSLTMPGEEVTQVPPELAFEERGRLGEPGWPKMAFIEHRLEHDPTNWWAPNKAALEAMLRSAGFRILANPGAETYLCEPDAANPSAVAGWNREEFIAATGRRRAR